jgi:chaperone required for assembly of F1-ATPase
MKKFYKTVSLGEKEENGYGLFLDGKPVRTPAKQNFVIPSLDLANIIVTEWANQGDEILPLTMPISQITMTLIDRVVPHRKILEDEILGYINTDLICYRTDEPEQYRLAQEKQWNPFVTWFQKKTGLTLQVTTGLSPLTQSPEIHQSIKNRITALADNQFMAVYLATLGTGSIILGLAFQSGEFDNDTILAAAFAEEHLKDEIYLGHIYGSAPDQEKKYKSLRGDLETLNYFIT